MELNIHITGRNKGNKNFSKFNNFSNFQYYLESSLKLSEIENKGTEQTKKFDSINSYNFESLTNSKSSEPKRKILDVKKKKLTKEDLNNIPLPIFSCIYCSNEKVAFNHLIKENIYNKFFLQTSIYDMKNLEEIIKINPIIDLYNKNPPLINLIIKNTEFIKHYYEKNELYNYFSSDIFKKSSEVNNIKIAKIFLQKIEDKYIRKRNKELSNNKYNSDKLFNFDEYKMSFQKQNNNNSSFTNENLTTNKNTFTNSIGNGLSTNIGLPSSIVNNIENVNNINNNINIFFNQNNMMQRIMEKIEKKEESDGKTEEKILDILGNKNNSTNKKNINNINFEEKYYDIWNPQITLIKEDEEDEDNNIKDFSERNLKPIKKIKNFIKKKHVMNMFNIDNINKEENIIINCNNENKIYKKIIYKRNILSPEINNKIKKKSLMNFINYNIGRNENADSLLLKHKFFTRDYNNFFNNNYNHKLEPIKNIISTKSKNSYNNTVSHLKQQYHQKLVKNLLNLLKSKPVINIHKKRINNINSDRLMRKTALSSQNNCLYKKETNNYASSNLLDINSKETEHKSININNDLYPRKYHDMNLDIENNNKKYNIFSKFNKINSYRSFLYSPLKEENDLISLPNLKVNLSPIYKIKINPGRKIRIKNSLRKINSYNILENKYFSLSRSSRK